jgi:hypothetical protein
MMMKKTFMFLFVLVIVLMVACGKSDEQKEAEEMAKSMEEAAGEMEESADDMAEAMKKMGEAMSGGEKVEAVDFRELKKLLPEELPGKKRVDASGEKTSSFGVNVSKAEAEYSNDTGETINIEIVDMGSMKGITAFTSMAWTMAEFDRETDSGYERTTTYKNFKAFEEYDNESKHGEIQLMIAERFLVQVDGYDITMEDLKDALDRIDLKKLESLKGVGTEK